MTTSSAPEILEQPYLPPDPLYGPFLPMSILGLAVVAWFAFQTFQMWNERDALSTTFTAQEKPFADSQKIRESLDSLARQLSALAEKGNPNARLVIDELKRRGINIDLKSTAPSPAAK